MRTVPRIQWTRAKTLKFSGRVRAGGAPRALVTKGDTLTFVIYDPETYLPVNGTARTNGDGVSVADDGSYRVIEDAAAMDIPAGTYGFELRIQEGDTGETYPLITGGELTLTDTAIP